MKFLKRWFGPYVVTSATYHIAELDGARIVIPLVGKWIKAFKKRHEAEPDPTLGTEGDVSDEEDK